MADSGFYRGVNLSQDGRYTDKEKKLLKQMKFESALDTKIDMRKVNLDVVKPWITAKLNAMLGLEDDIVAEFVFTQLEEKDLSPKRMQINLTGFLNARRAREFMDELWNLLLEAEKSPDGIPMSLINKKMEEIKKLNESTSRREVPMAKATENDWKNRYDSLVGGRYGSKNPNYASEPGAGDDINRSPRESPSNRRWRRERTPDFPIPRRRRHKDSDDFERDRPRRRERTPERRDRHKRSRSSSKERRKESRRRRESSSSDSDSKHRKSKKEKKSRKHRDSSSPDSDSRDKRHKSKKSKKDRD